MVLERKPRINLVKLIYFAYLSYVDLTTQYSAKEICSNLLSLALSILLQWQ